MTWLIPLMSSIFIFIITFIDDNPVPYLVMLLVIAIWVIWILLVKEPERLYRKFKGERLSYLYRLMNLSVKGYDIDWDLEVPAEDLHPNDMIYLYNGFIADKTTFLTRKE